MDIAQAFTYPFKSGKWLKIFLLAFLCNITVFGQVFTLGYTLRASRSYLRGEPLPDWNDWGSLFLDGIRVMALVLGYIFPGLTLISVTAMIMLFYGMLGHDSVIMTCVTAAFIAAAVIGTVLAFVGAVASEAAYMLLMREGSSIKECFNYRNIIGLLRGNVLKLTLFMFGLWAMYIVFDCLSVAVGSILHIFMDINFAHFLGISLIYPYASVITAVLFAQLAKKLLPRIID